MAGLVVRCGYFALISLASMALPTSAAAVHGGFPGEQVDVAFSGSEIVNHTETSWQGDGCYSTVTGGGQVAQTLRWDAKTPHATIYNRKAVLAAFFDDRVTGTREIVEDHYQKVHGSCSDTPGRIESGPGSYYDRWFHSGGCGTERYKADLNVANVRQKPSFMFADGWHADDAGEFENCANDLYEWKELKPRPWAGPGTNGKLDAVRSGRRKKAKFDFEHTYDLHDRYESPSYDPAENEGELFESNTQVTIRWEATVSRGRG